MNKQKASMLLMQKIIIPIKKINENNVSMRYVATFNSNLMSLGFTFSQDVMEACVENFTKIEFIKWSNEIQDILISYEGARQKMLPMYPDFPAQIMDTSELKLYLNALIHYASNGKWLPTYEEKIKLRTNSILSPKIIGLTNEKELMSYIEKLAELPVAMSDQQKQIFEFLVNEYGKNVYSSTYTMPNKENMVFVIYTISKLDFDKNTWYKHLANHNIKTITDILRLTLEYLGGDSSLSEQYAFRSIKRADRRFLLKLIDKLYKEKPQQVEEDAARHQKLWVVVLEQLHPGDYSSRFINAYKFATKVREDKLRSWYSKLEKAYTDNDLNKVISMLEKRPGEFARRLERTIRAAYKDDICGLERALNVVKRFKNVANQVDRTILLQLQAYFNKPLNSDKQAIRTFFPKGQMSKVYVTEDNREPLPLRIYLDCILICQHALLDIYSEREKLGNVYVDPEMVNFTVPLKLRNASGQFKTVSRGSRFKIPENTNILRLYTWWKDLDDNTNRWNSRIDVDLSAIFYDEDFNQNQIPVNYMNLKRDGCYHSGDIVSAPKGAAEFIDVDIEKLLNNGIRYVVMSLNNFTDVNYSDMPECFAGVMVLDEVKPNEKVFDPAKSLIRSDISTESTTCIPMVFDLKTKEVIWVDSIVPIYHKGPNNVEHCKDGIANLIRGVLTASYPTLFELICLNIAGRQGKIVENKEDADIIFSMDEGITPYSLEEILTNWI